MATSVEAFLSQNVVEPKTIEVKFDRFNAPFVIKPVSQAEADNIRKACTKRINNKQTGTITQQVDTSAYSDGLIKAAVVTPDLNNSDLQMSYGTPGKPIETLRAMLLVGEYAELGEKVQEISGFETETEDELVQDVKN
jgi:hypothetical protein